jgi:hypothetical protein
MPDSRDTLLDRMERWFRNQPVFSALMLCSAVVIGTSEVTEKGSNLMVDLGLKKEKALQLADKTAKGDLSRKVIELAYRRKFWTENYIARLNNGRPQEELDYTWNKHLDTVADWSSELMVTRNGMDQFYKGTNKSEEFQNIHNQFSEIETQCIVPLRRFKANDNQKHLDEENIAKEAENQLGYDLYCFAQGVNDPNSPEQKSPNQKSSCDVRAVNPAVSKCASINKTVPNQ